MTLVQGLMHSTRDVSQLLTTIHESLSESHFWCQSPSSSRVFNFIHGIVSRNIKMPNFISLENYSEFIKKNENCDFKLEDQDQYVEKLSHNQKNDLRDKIKFSLRLKCLKCRRAYFDLKSVDNVDFLEKLDRKRLTDELKKNQSIAMFEVLNFNWKPLRNAQFSKLFYEKFSMFESKLSIPNYASFTLFISLNHKAATNYARKTLKVLFVCKKLYLHTGKDELIYLIGCLRGAAKKTIEGKRDMRSILETLIVFLNTEGVFVNDDLLCELLTVRKYLVKDETLIFYKIILLCARRNTAQDLGSLFQEMFSSMEFINDVRHSVISSNVIDPFNPPSFMLCLDSINHLINRLEIKVLCDFVECVDSDLFREKFYASLISALPTSVHHLEYILETKNGCLLLSQIFRELGENDEASRFVTQAIMHLLDYTKRHLYGYFFMLGILERLFFCMKIDMSEMCIFVESARDQVDFREINAFIKNDLRSHCRNEGFSTQKAISRDQITNLKINKSSFFKVYTEAKIKDSQSENFHSCTDLAESFSFLSSTDSFNPFVDFKPVLALKFPRKTYSKQIVAKEAQNLSQSICISAEYSLKIYRIITNWVECIGSLPQKHSHPQYISGFIELLFYEPENVYRKFHQEHQKLYNQIKTFIGRFEEKKFFPVIKSHIRNDANFFKKIFSNFKIDCTRKTTIEKQTTNSKTMISANNYNEYKNSDHSKSKEQISPTAVEEAFVNFYTLIAYAFCDSSGVFSILLNLSGKVLDSCKTLKNRIRSLSLDYNSHPMTTEGKIYTYFCIQPTIFECDKANAIFVLKKSLGFHKNYRCISRFIIDFVNQLKSHMIDPDIVRYLIPFVPLDLAFGNCLLGLLSKYARCIKRKNIIKVIEKLSETDKTKFDSRIAICISEIIALAKNILPDQKATSKKRPTKSSDEIVCVKHNQNENPERTENSSNSKLHESCNRGSEYDQNKTTNLDPNFFASKLQKELILPGLSSNWKQIANNTSTELVMEATTESVDINQSLDHSVKQPFPQNINLTCKNSSLLPNEASKSDDSISFTTSDSKYEISMDTHHKLERLNLSDSERKNSAPNKRYKHANHTNHSIGAKGETENANTCVHGDAPPEFAENAYSTLKLSDNLREDKLLTSDGPASYVIKPRVTSHSYQKPPIESTNRSFLLFDSIEDSPNISIKIQKAPIRDSEIYNVSQKRADFFEGFSECNDRADKMIEEMKLSPIKEFQLETSSMKKSLRHIPLKKLSLKQHQNIHDSFRNINDTFWGKYQSPSFLKNNVYFDATVLQNQDFPTLQTSEKSQKIENRVFKHNEGTNHAYHDGTLKHQKHTQTLTHKENENQRMMFSDYDFSTRKSVCENMHAIGNILRDEAQKSSASQKILQNESVVDPGVETTDFLYIENRPFRANEQNARVLENDILASIGKSYTHMVESKITGDASFSRDTGQAYAVSNFSRPSNNQYLTAAHHETNLKVSRDIEPKSKPYYDSKESKLAENDFPCLNKCETILNSNFEKTKHDKGICLDELDRSKNSFVLKDVEGVKHPLTSNNIVLPKQDLQENLVESSTFLQHEVINSIKKSYDHESVSFMPSNNSYNNSFETKNIDIFELGSAILDKPEILELGTIRNRSPNPIQKANLHLNAKYFSSNPEKRVNTKHYQQKYFNFSNSVLANTQNYSSTRHINNNFTFQKNSSSPAFLSNLTPNNEKNISIGKNTSKSTKNSKYDLSSGLEALEALEKAERCPSTSTQQEKSMIERMNEKFTQSVSQKEQPTNHDHQRQSFNNRKDKQDQLSDEELECDIAIFIQNILSSDYHSPPMYERQFYATLADYIATFGPLIVNEARANTKQNSILTNTNLIEGISTTCISNPNFSLLDITTDTDQRICLYDYLRIAYKSIETNKNIIYGIVRSQSTTRSNLLKITVQLPAGIIVSKGLEVVINVLTSLSTQIREYQAIFNIRTSIFRKHIISESLPNPKSNDSYKTKGNQCSFSGGSPYASDSHGRSLVKLRKYSEPKNETITKIQYQFNLNYWQAFAIGVASMPENDFVLIQGPPGTGKTTTIVALIKSLTETKSQHSLNCKEPHSDNSISAKEKSLDESVQKPHISTSMDLHKEQISHVKLRMNDTKKRFLICAPSNSAADLIVKRLVQEIKAVNSPYAHLQLIRFGVTEMIDPALQYWTLDELIRRKTQTSEALQGPSVFLGQQKGFKSLKSSELQSVDIIVTTLSSSYLEILENETFSFDYLIVDEASQAIEPSNIIPFRHFLKKVILIGDSKQLAPTVLSENRILKNSLFHRMTFYFEQIMLREQYRMNQSLVELPNVLFYNSKLLTADIIKKRPNPFQNQLQTYTFVDVDGSERHSKCSSFFNVEEATAVSKFIHKIKVYKKNSIAVISPYKKQLNCIHETFVKLFKSKIPNNVKINTVDAFQGQEVDLVIISTVRTQKSGFIDDERRLNVSLTRAKHAVVIFGKKSFLTRIKIWDRLIRFYTEKKAIRSLKDFERKKTKNL